MATTTSAPSEASFTGDWPSGTSGYTVQLQTLPTAGTTVSAVEAAKTAASGKGAKAVGALKSEEFSSLTAGSYVDLLGRLPPARRSRKGAERVAQELRRREGDQGLKRRERHLRRGLRRVDLGRGRSWQQREPPRAASSLNDLKGAKGKSYEEKSKNLPDVVETG